MKIVDFGQSGCERVRRYMDSYISNELLVESNLEVLRHIEQCSRCSQELETRVRIRASLQTAARREDVPPGLEQKIRREIRESSPARLWPFDIPLKWMSAVAVLLLMSTAVWIVLRGRRGLSPQEQDAYLGQISSRLSSIFQVGLRDHVHCAVFRKYPKDPPAFAEMARELGPQYAGLIPLVRARVPDEYRAITAHHCSVKARSYTHLVLRSPSSLLSLIITKKNAGESFQAFKLEPVLQAAGVPVYRARASRFQVAAFETQAYLAFVISDLPEESNLQLAGAMAPSVQGFLSRL
ncbi:MAG: putative transrane anti-sigma factor [Bryobacterales bacterium]|nr:putative transrane anti-sigma factor [Bryobacterales bacterium]